MRDANYLGNVRILSGINRSRYDALTFLFRCRMPRMTMQAHYTLAGSYSYGGSTGNRSGAGLPQVWDEPFAENEWGPNGPDERHRFVLTWVFEAPYGVQLSPVVQWASARAYNLMAETDLNRTATTTIDGLIPQPVSKCRSTRHVGTIRSSLTCERPSSFHLGRTDGLIPVPT
jgi:hypothetical protein